MTSLDSLIIVEFKLPFISALILLFTLTLLKSFKLELFIELFIFEMIGTFSLELEFCEEPLKDLIL
jgi:hypothetical protein